MATALKQTELDAQETVILGAKKISVFAIAIWLSLAIHAAILSVKFQPEIKEFANKLPSLSVVLVNAKTKTAPEKADALAQANLDRGGNTDKNKQMKTALPPPKLKTTEVKLQPSAQATSSTKSAKRKAEEAKQQKRVAELEKQAQELMTQLKAVKSIDSNPQQDAAAAEPEKGDQKALQRTLNREDLLKASTEIDRLEAQLAKQQEEYQKRPKRNFIGARTREDRFAYYVESWRQKVERIGNTNYPQAAKAQKLYGQLQVTVSIFADGTVEKIEIEKGGSGHKVLDEAAKNIIRLAAPYPPFPADIKRDTDILSITRTWTFTQEDALSTQ